MVRWNLGLPHRLISKNFYCLIWVKLDSEYPDYEFEIIPIPPFQFLEIGLSLEPYEYFGELNEILDVKVKKILLYYNADILIRVEFIFDGDLFESLKLKLEEINNIELPKYLKLILRKDEKLTILMYQNKVLFVID